jgi:hypothetical protein
VVFVPSHCKQGFGYACSVASVLNGHMGQRTSIRNYSKLLVVSVLATGPTGYSVAGSNPTEDGGFLWVTNNALPSEGK